MIRLRKAWSATDEDDLRVLHCDLGQGYLIAKPLAPKALAAMMETALPSHDEVPTVV